MMRVVFDTNVYISAFVVPGSQGERAFLLARHQRFELYASVAILTETANKLRDKFGQPDEDIEAALRLVSRAARVVKPRVRLTVAADEPDNRILECAVEAAADIVVTGDRHLLKLKQHGGATLLRLGDFLRLFPDDDGRTGGG